MTSLFGQKISSQNQNPLFGASNNQPSGGGLFPNNSSSSLFGTGNNNGTSLFGNINANQNSGNLFGNNDNNNKNTSLFGTPNNASTGVTFGANNGTNNNNKPPGGGIFGTTSNDNNKPSGGLFGTTNNINNNPSGVLFGTNNNDNKKPTGGGLFDTTNNDNNKPSGGLFGTTNNINNNPSGGLFGTTNNDNNKQAGGGLFGTNNNDNNKQAGGGLFGTNNNDNNKQAGGGLFGTTNNDNNKQAGGGLFGTTNNDNNKQAGGLFGINNKDNTNKTNGTSFLSQADDTNKPKESSSSNPLFGFNSNTTKEQTTTTINTSVNTTTVQKENKSGGNISLFSGNSNTDSTAVQKGTGLFGKLENNTTNENKTSANSLFGISQTGQNSNKNEEKKEEKAQISNTGNLFGVNIQQKTENKPQSQNLFGAQSQPKEEQNKNQLNNNQPDNNNVQNNNQPNNNESNEYKFMNKMPEVPFQFSECKELQENEKNQLLHKTNYEIVEELKNMLITQKKKFKECTENTRIFESKCMDMFKINLDNAKISKMNEKNGEAVLEKINSINERSKYLKNTIEFIDNKMTGVLKPYKENIMNRDNILFNQTNVDKFKFYEDFINVSKKCFSIENDLNETEQILSNKDKELSDRLNDQVNNNGSNGIWIERPNKIKLFINQNEMNSLLSECYDGLMNLKNMQDSFDIKYDLLKQNLIKATGNNNI